MYRLHQELIGLRRRNPWLHYARTETLELTNTALVYRAYAGDDHVHVVLDLGDDPIDYSLGGDVLAGQATVEGGRVTVPPHGWAVFGRK